MELLQAQSQQLNQQQIQGVRLLQMGAPELEQYLQELALENPLIDLEPDSPAAEADRVSDYLRWLEDNDHQNLYYQRMDEEEIDALALVGTGGGLEETLPRVLLRQLDPMNLDADVVPAVRYLIFCLDRRGYLTTPLEELSEAGSIPVKQLERALRILQSLEPAGVGAGSLSQCFEIQLRRIHETGPALEIVRNYLELLARRHYQAIASRLELPVEKILEAEKVIRGLNPRPGAVFEQPEQIPYIVPDVFVEEQSGAYVARVRKAERPPFRINPYYQILLHQSEDRQVRDYLQEKLQQVEGILWAISQRESTILRCAQVIVDVQRDFFRCGPRALRLLRQADVAGKLGLHASTVSRAVRDKYLQCAQGVYPMSYFFSRPAAASGEGAGIGSVNARLLLKRIIGREDRRKPWSDAKLSALLGQAGCPISRRTVAKYRAEMNIPDAAGRRHWHEQDRF